MHCKASGALLQGHRVDSAIDMRVDLQRVRGVVGKLCNQVHKLICCSFCCLAVLSCTGQLPTVLAFALSTSLTDLIVTLAISVDCLAFAAPRDEQAECIAAHVPCDCGLLEMPRSQQAGALDP